MLARRYAETKSPSLGLVNKVLLSFKKNRIFLLSSLVLGVFIAQYLWWFFAEFHLFRLWYSSYAFLIFSLKNIALGLYFIASIYSFLLLLKDPFVKRLFKSNIAIAFNPKLLIFTPYVALSILIGEEHPFSRVPMYSSFSKTAFIFTIDNCAGEIIPLNKLSESSGADLSHIYFSYIYSPDYKTDSIGAFMWQSMYIPEAKLNLEKGACYCLNKQSIGEEIYFGSKNEKLYQFCAL